MNKTSTNTNKSNKKEFVTFAIIPAVLVLIVAIMLIPSIIVWNTNTFNTYINGYDVSLKDYDETYDIISNNIDNYKLIIEGREHSDIEIYGADIDLRLNFGTQVEEVMYDRNKLLAIFDIFGNHSYDLEYSVEYNEDKLVEILDNLDILSAKNMKYSKDAYISKTPDNGKFSIVEEVYGTRLDTDKTKNKIREAIENRLEVLDLNNEGVYEDPTILSSDTELLDQLESFNELVNVSIGYNVNGKTFKFDSNYISNYIVTDENGTYISEDCYTDFVNKMNSQLTTMGNSIKFLTHDGETITVPGGNWGWWLNTSETKAKLKEAIASKSSEAEVVWYQEAPYYGDYEFLNYIEVDMTEQHLYIYTDGELNGDYNIVTGTYTNSGRRTPEGVYVLNYKTRNAVLKGPTWESPVSYWMPFNGGIGFHDASWRSSFGGTIYMYNGSHGCINMPKSGAEHLYSLIDKTYAIICYY